MKYKINWSKFKGTTKLPAQKVVKQSDPYEFSIKKAKESKIRSVFGSDPTKQPTITLGIEEARKVARGVEARSHRGLTKKVESAFKSTMSKPSKSNQFSNLIKQKQRALTKAFKLSLKRGVKAGERKTEKLGFSKSMFYSGAKDRPASFYKKKSFISAEQSRKLGFPQSEMSLSAKYDLDIGPKTVKLIKEIIDQSNTVMWNGPAGFFENKKFAIGTNAIAQKISENTANKSLVSVLGGGDTVSAINKSGYKLTFTHLSTAGGAFLEYLEGKDLPGLSVLK